MDLKLNAQSLDCYLSGTAPYQIGYGSQPTNVIPIKSYIYGLHYLLVDPRYIVCLHCLVADVQSAPITRKTDDRKMDNVYIYVKFI